MVRKIFLFELYYRFQRSTTYVYFALVILLSFFIITSPTAKLAGAIGQVYANAPFVMAAVFLILSFFLTVISSAVMGVAMIRDSEHNMEALLFTTRAGRFEYLAGRFAGSFVTLIFIGSGAWLGLMAGYLTGMYLPWEVSWKHIGIVSITPWDYILPFLYFMVPNLFITGAFFFMSGALIRNTIVLYTQGILLLLLYQLGATFLQGLDSRTLASLLDPFGVIAFLHTTQYWTPVEKNTMMPMGGVMLFNRLLWLALAAMALIVAFVGYTPRQPGGTSLFTKRNRQGKMDARKVPWSPVIPRPGLKWGRSISRGQLWRSSVLYLSMILREIPFLAIVICGLAVVVFNATKLDDMYGTSSYPTTYVILKLLESFGLFFFVIAIFYSGELVWLDRRHNFNQITDALPVPGLTHLLSRFLGLVLVYVLLIVILILVGVTVQAAYGYFTFSIGVYFGTLFGSTLSSVILFTALAFFIQVVVNNKFLGFVISIAVILGEALMVNAGVDSDFILFAGGSLNVFSDMNGYGHHIEPFVWLRTYWLAFGSMLFLLTVLFWSGRTASLKHLWRKNLGEFSRPLVAPFLVCLAIFLVTGSVMYYNGRVVNIFQSSGARTNNQAEYEQTFKSLDSIPQPKIVEVSITLDLHPSSRDFFSRGYYILKNKTSTPISEMLVQVNPDTHLSVESLGFDRSATLLSTHEKFRLRKYSLQSPLNPGDSIRMDFSLSFVTNGFELRGWNNGIVYNGTFLNQSWFPSIGYSPSFEITDDEERFQHGLSNQTAMAPAQSPEGRNTNQYGDDADYIRFQATVGTEADQLAVAPGRLVKQWSDKGRRYFHYKMDRPMPNFYSFLSGRYLATHEKWDSVDVEIYYHPEHYFNVETMTGAIKDALSYCSENFNRYDYGAVRIVEFPRYSTFAQSFAQTIPYSEGVGFIFKVRDPARDLDMTYYSTVHEVAHQWWGQQILHANVRGGSMLSEGLAQYTALMIVKGKFPSEIVERYLQYELNGYLTGRSAERQKEEPLSEVESKNYIHYSKASLAFFALQDYIGETNLNLALKRFCERWSFKSAPYPTSINLIESLRSVTPDSLQYVIDDLFENITLYDNVASQSYYEPTASGGFEVSLKVSVAKYRADSVGRETPRILEDWIDIGIYALDETGEEKLVYLRKHRITRHQEVINIVVQHRPVRAGVDPLHKLIDRHPNDNTVEVIEVVDLATVPLE